MSKGSARRPASKPAAKPDQEPVYGLSERIDEIIGTECHEAYARAAVATKSGHPIGDRAREARGAARIFRASGCTVEAGHMEHLAELLEARR